MPQVQANKEYNTFVRGMITESGPLTYPENASIDEANFTLLTNGYRKKRLGIDIESNQALQSFSDSYGGNNTGLAINTYVWKNADSSDGSFEILVVQIGKRVRFYNLNPSVGTVQEAYVNGVDYFTIDDADETQQMQFVSTSVGLVVVFGGDYCYLLKYLPDNDYITKTIFSILTRDIWGVDDQYDVNYRAPSVLDREWLYNKGNQGWMKRNNLNDNPYLFHYLLDYPSNADAPASGIDTTDENTFKPDLVLKALKTNKNAPKGYYIIDLFRRGLSRYTTFINSDEANNQTYSLLNNYGDSSWRDVSYSGARNYGVHSKCYQGAIFGTGSTNQTLLVTLNDDTTNGGLTCAEAHGGRVFYGGFYGSITQGYTTSPEIGSYIAYSQILDDSTKIGKCYQEGDPTSVDDFDLLETDGGLIKLSGCGTVHQLVSMGNSLYVFASNGIWTIEGKDGNSFSPTDFVINKVSNVGVDNKNSIVLVKEAIFFWNKAGIHILGKDETCLNTQVVNLVKNTIRTYFVGLSSQAKSHCKGSFNEHTNTVSWTYKDTGTDEASQYGYLHDTQLVFDLDLKAFYKYDFAYDTGLNQISVYGTFTNKNGREYYLTTVPEVGSYKWAFSYLKDTTFRDWLICAERTTSASSRGYSAYLFTGFEILDDSQRQKQLNYITTHMERTETGFQDVDGDLLPINDSECWLTVHWDYHEGTFHTDKKITEPVQIYRLGRDYIASGDTDSFDYKKTVITTKNKIRGRGRSAQLLFRSPPDKNCILYGWGIPYLVNTEV